MILLDEKDVIAVTWPCSRLGAREIKIHPLGHLRFCRARSPCLRSQRQEATRTRTPGWLARLIRVHHLAGKRLGSEVLADPLISIGGRSHYQREVLQLPLQHGDRAA